MITANQKERTKKPKAKGGNPRQDKKLINANLPHSRSAEVTQAYCFCIGININVECAINIESTWITATSLKVTITILGHHS
jgi:hypothetical protein